MRRRARAALPLALAAAAGAAAIIASWRTRPSPPPPPMATPARLTYPARRLPVLTMPDGERRAVRSLLNVRRPLRYGEFAWNADRVPVGPVWVRVDLAGQTLSVFRAGHEIGTAVVLYGTDGKPTPTGVFPVLEKARRHRSTLYDADMPYMLRLTGDGVAIHASDVRSGHATHGCIGVPPAFARLLFDAVRRRDPVAILPPRRTHA